MRVPDHHEADTSSPVRNARSDSGSDGPPWDHDDSMPEPPSPASPSFSPLPSPDLPPFSPYQGQSPSPAAGGSPFQHPRGTGSARVVIPGLSDSQDRSKGILLQRLNGLIARLSRDSDVDEDSASHLHAILDEMEDVIDAGGSSRVVTTKGEPDPAQKMPGLTAPSHIDSEHPITQSSPETLEVDDHEVKIQRRRDALEVQRITQEAQELNSNLESIMESLQERQEEVEVNSP